MGEARSPARRHSARNHSSGRSGRRPLLRRRSAGTSVGSAWFRTSHRTPWPPPLRPRSSGISRRRPSSSHSSAPIKYPVVNPWVFSHSFTALLLSASILSISLFAGDTHIFQLTSLPTIFLIRSISDCDRSRWNGRDRSSASCRSNLPQTASLSNSDQAPLRPLTGTSC